MAEQEKLTSEKLQNRVDVAKAQISRERLELEVSKVPEAEKVLKEVKSPGSIKRYFDVAKAAQAEMDQNPRLWEAMKGMQEAGYEMPLRDSLPQFAATEQKGKGGVKSK